MPSPRIPRTVPWPWLLQVAKAAPLVKRHWDKLTPAERRRLQELVLKSKGRPSNLSVAERLAVRRLVQKLQLTTLGRDLGRLATRRRPRGSGGNRPSSTMEKREPGEPG